MDCALLKILFHEDVLDDIVLSVVIRVFNQFNEFLARQLPFGSLDFWGGWYVPYAFGVTETILLFCFFLCFALAGLWRAVSVWWGRGLRTISAEMSFLLAVEALAFIHEVSAFFSGHAAGMSMAWSCVHGIGILTSTFAVESLSPLV